MTVEELGIALVMDGQESGVQMAYEALEAAQSDVAVENQTWDSAIAILKLLKSKLEEGRTA